MQSPTLSQYILSYLWGTLLESTSSPHNPTLEVWLVNGKKTLNATRANYSYGNLHTVFQQTFRKIKVKEHPPKNVLVLGFGAGSIAGILFDELKLDCNLTGVEIDQTVLNLGKKHFGTDRFTKLRLYCNSAEVYVADCREKFDLICIDVFNDLVVPSSVETTEFLEAVKKCLAPGGTVVFNKVIDSKNKQKTFTALKEKMSSVFPGLSILKLNSTNRVLVGKCI